MSYLLTGLRLGMILVSLEHRWAGVRWQVSWGTSWVSCNLKFNVNIDTFSWGKCELESYRFCGVHADGVPLPQRAPFGAANLALK